MKLIQALVLSFFVLSGCTSPSPEVEAPPVEPPVEEEAVEEQPEPQPEEEFVVTEEVYTKTFDEIEQFIRNLNDIIKRKDYDTWLTYLSEQYIQQRSDPAYLQRQSQQPLLKKSNITLYSLRDYFDHVVVPSRFQTELDEIEFVNEDQVKAYAVIRNTKALLFLLVRDAGDWKIGVL